MTSTEQPTQLHFSCPSWCPGEHDATAPASGSHVIAHSGTGYVWDVKGDDVVLVVRPHRQDEALRGRIAVSWPVVTLTVKNTAFPAEVATVHLTAQDVKTLVRRLKNTVREIENGHW